MSEGARAGRPLPRSDPPGTARNLRQNLISEEHVPKVISHEMILQEQGLISAGALAGSAQQRSDIYFRNST
jgi:hypothetical protein